jgi:hypothetical protein
MILSEKEVKSIRDCLARVEQWDTRGMKRKHFATNQVRNIRLILNRAERREKNTLL